MKKPLLLLLLVLISTQTFGQKAKIRTKQISYPYEVYSDLEGYHEVRNFTIKIVDNKGTEYSYSEGNTAEAKKADIHNELGIAYQLKSLVNSSQLFIEVIQNSSVQNEKELLIFEDPATKVKKYAYKISAVQNYTVKLFNPSNNELIKEFNIDHSVQTQWPGQPSTTVGYTSKKLLDDNFIKKEETEEGFIKMIESKLIAYALNGKIGDQIKRTIHDSNKKIVYPINYVKTKDDKFVRLDSAVIYLDLGFEQIKINNKADLKGNHHLQNTKDYFMKAHNIFLAYSSDEYINWFTDVKLKDEYIHGMMGNLYFSSFLVLDFKKAEDIYSILNKKVEDQNGASQNTNSLAGATSSLRRTEAGKTLSSISAMHDFLIREKELSTVFKERYGY